MSLRYLVGFSGESDQLNNQFEFYPVEEFMSCLIRVKAT